MEYERSDTSGTDDDLPPSQSGRMSRGGRVAGSGRAMSSGGGGRFGRSAPNQHLRKLEKEAYVAVLRAFTAQSEVITWRKEELMMTLRKELRISDEMHLEILNGMDSHGAPQQYRERRPLEEDHGGGSMYAMNMDMGPAASRKRAKTSHGLQPNLQLNLPPPTMQPAFPSSTPPPLTGQAKRVQPGGGARSKKSKGGRQPPNSLSAKFEGVMPGINPWVGKRVKLRWPADNAFYDAVISDYDPLKDLHALVYDMDTVAETWEWVDLKKLSSNDLQVLTGPPVDVTGKNPPSASTNFGAGSRGVAGRGSTKKGGGRNNLASHGRGRTLSKGPSNSFERGAPAVTGRNVLDTKGLKHIQLPSLAALVKQVDRIAEEDDLAKIESIKRAAKEHEDMLRKALAEIGESSEEGESDEENGPFSHAHSIERERRSRQDSRDQHGYDDEDDTAGDRDDGLAGGGRMLGHGGGVSEADEEHNDGDDG